MAAVLSCSATRCFTSRVVWPTLRRPVCASSSMRVGVDARPGLRLGREDFLDGLTHRRRRRYDSSARDHLRLDEGDLVLGDAVPLVERRVSPDRGPMSASGPRRRRRVGASWVIFRRETRKRTEPRRIVRPQASSASASESNVASERGKSAVHTDAAAQRSIGLLRNMVDAIAAARALDAFGTSTFHLSIQVRVRW